MSESKHMGRCRSEMTAAYRAKSFKPNDSDEVIADAIDRLAADVAEVREAVCDGSVAEERDRFLAGMAAAIRERDEARAEVERLTARLGDRAEVQQTQLSAAFTEGTLQAGDAMRARFEQVEKERDEARAAIKKLKESRDEANRLYGATLVEVERLKNELYDREQEILSLRADTVERYEPPTAPQPAAPPAGWLTEEERTVVEDIAYMIEQWFNMAWSDTDVKRCAVLRSIVARAGSPPVVEVPAMQSWEYTAHEEALAYRAAMDKAGVPWKEV